MVVVVVVQVTKFTCRLVNAKKSMAVSFVLPTGLHCLTLQESGALQQAKGEERERELDSRIFYYAPAARVASKGPCHTYLPVGGTRAELIRSKRASKAPAQR